MKRLLSVAHALRLLVISILSVCCVSAYAVTIDPFNSRPVSVGASDDGASENLQPKFNSLGLPFNVKTDQKPTGMWGLGGPFLSSIPVGLFEVAGFAASSQVGIWSDLNGDSDSLGRTLIDIFLGAAIRLPLQLDSGESHEAERHQTRSNESDA